MSGDPSAAPPTEWIQSSITLDPIPARRHRNLDGTLGGLVALDSHADPTVHIGPEVQVQGGSTLLDSVRIIGRVGIEGQSTLAERAIVEGPVEVGERSAIYGDAVVRGTGHILFIHGRAILREDAAITSRDDFLSGTLGMTCSRWGAHRTRRGLVLLHLLDSSLPLEEWLTTPAPDCVRELPREADRVRVRALLHYLREWFATERDPHTPPPLGPK
jgi:hypothetical protein